ncbi:MAG: hypothetical protein AAGD14_16240 [Planctomycetota bacterium]
MKRLTLLLILALFTVSCGRYYRVRDPDSNRVYYTRSIENKKSGSIKFEDANTGTQITLTKSEVQKIDKEDYQKNVNPEDATGSSGW